MPLALNFWVYLFVVCSSSLVCGFMSLVRFGAFSAIISLSLFTALPSFPLLPGLLCDSPAVLSLPPPPPILFLPVVIWVFLLFYLPICWHFPRSPPLWAHPLNMLFQLLYFQFQTFHLVPLQSFHCFAETFSVFICLKCARNCRLERSPRPHYTLSDVLTSLSPGVGTQSLFFHSGWDLPSS